jgi:carbonic anhydrase
VRGIFLFFVAGSKLLYLASLQRLVHLQQYKELMMIGVFAQVNKLNGTLQLIRNAQKEKIIKVGEFNKVKIVFTAEMNAHLEKMG